VTAATWAARPVPGTDLTLGVLGFGGAVLGNLYRAVDEGTALAAVDTAWERGIRYFDTAPHYGLGLSERRLGAALAQRPRAEYVVSSKVGRLIEARRPPLPRDHAGFDVPGDLGRRRDYSRDGVLRSLEATLERTGLDRIDLLYVHDPDEHWDQAAREAVPALVELRDQGVVRAIGAGMNQSAMLARFLRETDVDVVMLAGRYTLLDQGALDDVLPAAVETGKAVVAVGVFNSGILATDTIRRDAHYDYTQAPPELLDRARRIAAVCGDHCVALPAAAMAFPLQHPAVVDVTLGMRTPAHVERNADLLRVRPPRGSWDELWADLRAQRLLRPDGR
jgi:D-threo-aldose 1-dehydrogenase